MADLILKYFQWEQTPEHVTSAWKAFWLTEISHNLNCFKKKKEKKKKEEEEERNHV